MLMEHKHLSSMITTSTNPTATELTVLKKLTSIDERGERYRLNHAIVVKLYYNCTQFPRNVRLPRRRIATFSAHRPTEGRRLSRPGWLVTYRDGLPAHRRLPILVLTGSDVRQLR